MVAPTSLPGAAIQQIDVRSRLLFSWRAKDGLKALTGQTGVFTRASESGIVPGALGRLVGPLQDDLSQCELVDLDGDGVPETVGMVLQGLRTNLMATKDLDSWTKGGTPVVTAIEGPDGKAGSAFTVEDDDGAAQETIYVGISFTGDATKSVVWVVKENTMPGSGVQDLQLWDSTTGVGRARFQITSWTAGEPNLTTINGTLLDKFQLGVTGWWVIVAQAAGVVAANTNRIFIVPAITANQTGKIDVFLPGAFDAVVPPHPFLDASISRAKDTLYFDYLADPQVQTAYLRFVERGTAAANLSLRLFHIGAVGSATDPRFWVEAGSGVDYRAFHDDGTTTVNSSPSGHTPSLGDEVEVRAVLFLDGSVQEGVSINGGVEEVGPRSGVAALQSAWADQRLYLNSGGSTSEGFNTFLEAKIAAGNLSVAQMREVM